MTLRLEDLDTPYFVQYAVDDTVSHRVSATYGAIVSSTRSRSRILHSQLRVGSYELDNSNFAGGRGGGGRAGLSISAELPIDDGYMALRQAIWRATDWQYKSAVETLTQKRSYLKDRTVADRPRDFNKAGAVIVIRERAGVSFDRNAWEEYARRISARFGDYRKIQDSGVSLRPAPRIVTGELRTRACHGKTEALLRSQRRRWQRMVRVFRFPQHYAPTLERLRSRNSLMRLNSRTAWRCDSPHS